MAAAYIAAQLVIHDREQYDRYVAGFVATLKGFTGEVLAADERPDVVAGAWPYDKFVLIKFADRDEALRWASSPAYRAISVDREAATSTTAIVLRGLE